MGDKRPPRMAHNPDPLRVVESRAGGPAPDRMFLVCQRIRKGRTYAASIHRTGCRRAPVDGRERADGSVWTVSELDRAEVSGRVALIEEQSGVEVAAWCSGCGGWSALP